jgi:RNA polymerase sigma factor for flagellar operon FliA
MSGVATYVASRNINQSELFKQYAPLLKRIAYHLISRLPPSVQVEDLIQAGVVGLLEAARNYDPSQGASFETYAGIRMRGAMLDELRRTDWTPRSVHRNTRKLADAIQEIERREGRPARDTEIAKEMQIEIHEYHRLLRHVSGAKVLSVDEIFSPGEEYGELEGGPYERLQEHAFKEELANTIEGLPERERMVIALYYDEELNLREIGEVLGVTESRVCQIHGQALVRLRARMKHWFSSERALGNQMSSETAET